MKILVGSQALKHFDLNRGQPKDFDFWVDSEDDKDFTFLLGNETIDVHEQPTNILNKVEFEVIDGVNVATPDSIYTIKLSHFVYDEKWDKTKLDIYWLKQKGCKLLPDLYDDLCKHWKMVHGDKKFLSLKKDKKDFFNDFVTYVYDHDYLHEVVSFPDKPVYTRCLKEGEEVMIDKEKFFSMTFEDQVKMFREEIAVIAFERWMVTSKVFWMEAYSKALRKTVTSLTKGWASRFIVENIEFFIKPDVNYFKNLIELQKRGNKLC